MTDRGYKRSWKNLLINKRYQLRFTLFMVGLSAVLMGLLGWWVVRVADEATKVAQSSILGEGCPPLPTMPKPAGAAPAAPAPTAPAPTEPALAPTAPAPTEPAAPAPTADPGAAPTADPATAPTADPATAPTADPATAPTADPAAPAATDDAADPDDPAGPARRRAVVIQESKIDIEPAPAPPPVSAAELAQQIDAHNQCERARQARIDEFTAGKRRILYVMIASGVLLTLGLAVFGIKMTHRVAGPLYKVTLYLAKLRDGRYDKVYDLRRGDQLVEFYEHFKHAHAGVVAMEQADVERIKAALEAATSDGALERSDDAKAAAAALREVLARKEKSLG